MTSAARRRVIASPPPPSESRNFTIAVDRSPAPARPGSRRPASCLFLSALTRKPISTSTAGMFADSRTRSGACVDRRAAPAARDPAAAAASMPAKAIRLDRRWRNCARSHGTSSMSRSAAAERRQPLRRERCARRCSASRAKRGREDRSRPPASSRSEAFACRLMNRSALLLLAMRRCDRRSARRGRRRASAARGCRGAPSIAALSRRATASVEIFFLRAARALHALVVAAVAGVDRNRADRRGRLRRTRAAARAAGRRGSGGRRGGWLRVCADDEVDRSVRVAGVDGLRRCAERGEARPEIDRERRRRRRRGRAARSRWRLRQDQRIRRVERVGVELDREPLAVLRARCCRRAA